MKPNIQRLFDAFRTFSIDCQKAGYSPEAWIAARNKLKETLDNLGIADNFNWEGEEP